MDGNFVFLFAALVVVWLGIVGYLVMLSGRVSALRRELDVVFYDGAAIDLGEAVAETLVLSLDPYPRAPGAGETLKAAGVKSEEEAGPFGALVGLRDKLKK